MTTSVACSLLKCDYVLSLRETLVIFTVYILGCFNYVMKVSLSTLKSAIYMLCIIIVTYLRLKRSISRCLSLCSSPHLQPQSADCYQYGSGSEVNWGSRGSLMQTHLPLTRVNSFEGFYCTDFI